MDCREVRQQLSAYLDGELPPAAREGVEAHVAACRACRQELAALQATVRFVHALPRLTAPEGLEKRIAARLAEPAPVVVRRTWLRVLRPALIAAGIGVLVLVFSPDSQVGQAPRVPVEEKAAPPLVREEERPVVQMRAAEGPTERKDAEKAGAPAAVVADRDQAGQVETRKALAEAAAPAPRTPAEKLEAAPLAEPEAAVAFVREAKEREAKERAALARARAHAPAPDATQRASVVAAERSAPVMVAAAAPPEAKAAADKALAKADMKVEHKAAEAKTVEATVPDLARARRELSDAMRAAGVSATAAASDASPREVRFTCTASQYATLLGALGDKGWKLRTEDSAPRVQRRAAGGMVRAMEANGTPDTAIGAAAGAAAPGRGAAELAAAPKPAEALREKDASYNVTLRLVAAEAAATQ